MRKEFIFAIVAGTVGAIIGYAIGKISTERKIEKECEEPRIIRLYPETESSDDEENLDEFDPEDSEDDISKAKDIAKENNYIPVEDDLNENDKEAIESAREYQQYMEKHAGEISVISPDYEKRSDSVNNVLDMMDTEMLLYFPDEDALLTELGDRCEIEEFVGNCLFKYGFASDPRQTELHILNVPHEMHYIVRKETENSVEDLFPDN